ncbi:uncharacterized protein TA21350 [Theileria annulata]|uniref:Uncharacterized protein n=1 Tax=Theileria annulata TaxID=5874 RepID=Q4UGN7_THEAN|nr:uncharacterized protein TA21350 [Theileria annulata]CAI73752.1 hypothetical protein, conserved [Theileria annulata]|eukprot:XP_954429.1 hypothetical protein, conserved [Theileria annulata]
MDEKYKSLKTKHVYYPVDLLKEAFKKLYFDYETVKNDLSSKLEEFSKLHEENSQLKQNYDLLLNEINQNTRLKGVQSWTNALTLIKGSTHDTDSQKYIDEINSLKSKLETSVKHTDELEVVNAELERDLEDVKAKHNVVVSELKDRLLGLEGILKDLQEQLNKNENKLIQYSNDIKLLNNELDNKNNQIFQLNQFHSSYIVVDCVIYGHRIENEKNEYEKDKIEWNKKLNEKFKFDLRRNHYINLNNSYQNPNLSEVYGDRMSINELMTIIMESLNELFKCWNSCIKFVQCTKINNEESDSEVANDYTFITLFTNDVHILRNIDTITQKITGILMRLCNGLELLIDGTEKSNFTSFLQDLKELFKYQRIYFCTENYLIQYSNSEVDNPSTANPGTVNPNVNSNTVNDINLIKVFGSFSKILTKLYKSFHSILYLSEVKSVNYSNLLINELINEFTISYGETNSQAKDNSNSVDFTLNKSYNLVYASVKDLTVLLLELRDILSHRICYPKIVKGLFLPFSGGTKQMVQLSASITKLHENLVLLTESRINTYITKFILSNNEVNSTVKYIEECNKKLVNSDERINLTNLETELSKAKRNENELNELRIKYSNVQEQLSLETLNANNYLNELNSLKKTDHIQTICTNLFNETFNKYTINTTGTDESVNEELMLSNSKINKLTNNIKYLIKMVNNLEDTNNQLKLALQVNKDQYKQAKENEDSIHRNYNEQLVLMSEHITELNNAILASEYKIAELTQTKVSCPSCGFNNTLGSMMGVDDKGRCSSCRSYLFNVGMKKPDFDVKKVVNEECVKRCVEFIPKFKESTLKVESDIKEGKLDFLDSNLKLYKENDSNIKLVEESEDLEDSEQSIVLDVGLGVFDVKGKTPSEKTLKEAGVSVVDVKEDLQAKNEEVLISEVKTRKYTK